MEKDRTLAESIDDPTQSDPARACPEVLHRVKLPLVLVAHAARADQEITPARASEILLEQEAASAFLCDSGV